MSKKKKKTVDEKIAEELDIELQTEQPKEIEVVRPKESSLTKEKATEDANKDYRSVRCNLHAIISKGNEAIDGILEVAAEGDQPRAYEVAAQMIKTVADANKDLMDLHKKMKELKKEDITFKSTTNQSIYVGSTKELQELVNQTRSASRRIGTDDIIDVEVVDNGKQEDG
ncbi:TPA: terminase [Candidatus Woesearchaeota archaeon]|nr:terminase [Candidatus Woesearchaeota archaeon]|tara:strand:- start:459 stop:968 length:510 start_codon:yes stop_codon:yes gene_type:complete